VSRGAPTRVTLRRLFAALLAAAAAVMVASVWAGAALHSTASDFHARSVPSIVAVLAARGALVEADAGAVCSFVTGGAQVAGPGEQYQNQISVASQSLAQVAEHNIAGDPASQQIQLIDGLLAAYTGLIEQADAAYRQNHPLGAVYLWYASRLLHDPGEGILRQLDVLYSEERTALEGQLRSGGTSWWWIVAWTAPCVILLALMVLAQVYLRRRFRRRVNASVAAATVLLLALVAGMASITHGGQQVGQAWHTADTAATAWHNRQDDTERMVLTGPMPSMLDGCAPSTAASDCPSPASSFGRANDNIDCGGQPADLSAGSDLRAADGLAASAADTTLDQALVLAVALAVITLMVLGFLPRIEEYRYRPR
jgi:hypothetical protein